MIMSEVNSDYDKHLDVARSVEATRDESWRYVEKMQYAIASGALALSVTLLTFTDVVQCKWLIITSWILLVASILINFASHIVSYIASDTTREKMFDRMREGTPYEPNAINDIINKYNKPTMWLNIVSIAFLAFGVIGLLIFFITQIL